MDEQSRVAPSASDPRRVAIRLRDEHLHLRPGPWPALRRNPRHGAWPARAGRQGTLLPRRRMDGSREGRFHLDGTLLPAELLRDRADADAIHLLQKCKSRDSAMSEKIYRDADVDDSILKGKTIAVIGYGIQGKAQAANTRDSGFKVIIGCRGPEDGSKSREQAKADGFDSFSIADAAKKADILLIELADPVQPGIYKKDIGPNLRAGQTLCFCHGFSVLYGQIQPPKDVNTVLFVPNAPGAFVREKYKKGEGVYGCVAVDHDATGDG